MCHEHNICDYVHYVQQLLHGSPGLALPQFLPRLEMRCVLGRNFDPVARLGISAEAGWPVIELEAAKALDLDALGGAQGGRHGGEECGDGQIRVLELRKASGQAGDKFLAGCVAFARAVRYFDPQAWCSETGQFPKVEEMRIF